MASVIVAALAVGHTAFGDAGDGVCSDEAYLTWKESESGSHTLSIVDFRTGEREDVATLDHHVNAIGYSARDGLLYGLARSRDGVGFADAPHLVAVDASGRLRDLGGVRSDGFARDGLSGAYAGTVRDGELVVLSRTRVTFIGLDGDRGRVTKQVELAERLDRLHIGDVTTAGDEGLLYGLSTEDGAVVSIDPGTGAVDRTTVAGLPSRSLAGAIFAGSDGRLHAVVNGGGDGEAVMYRVPVPGRGSTLLRAVVEARWPRLTSADAAFCPAPPDEPPDEPRPSPRASASPAPASAGPSTASVAPSQRSVAPQPRQRRPQSPPAHGRPPDSRAAAQREESETPRRWIAVGAVVIGMAGAAGVKASAGRRSK